jgi:hypothetical protein
MARCTGGVLIVLFLAVLMMNCSSKPKACPTCKGTGKVSKSVEISLPAEIVKCDLINRGVINPDYLSRVTIENNGEKDGIFTVYVDFDYKGIGTHTEEGELFVKAHSQATKEIRYDADKYADSYKCRAKSPVVIQTIESICPTCGGSGMLK